MDVWEFKAILVYKSYFKARLKNYRKTLSQKKMKELRKKRKESNQERAVHRLLIPVLRRHGRLYLSEFKVSLVYKESSWIARQSQRETLS